MPASVTRRKTRLALYGTHARAEARRSLQLRRIREWETRLESGDRNWGTCFGDLSPFDRTKPRGSGCTQRGLNAPVGA